jgi:hypothetical protein
MDKDLIKLIAGAAVRHGLTALSAYLVAQNLLAPDHAATFVTQTTAALPGVLAFGWSLVQKFHHHDATTY